MRNIYILLAVAIVFSSCFRLDDNLFNPSSLEAYQLDGYSGEVDFSLPPSLNIPDDQVHIFTINEIVNEEQFKIYTIYIGDTNSISTDTVLLYYHGNRDHMDFYWPRAELLANLGYSILMFEFPGFGLDKEIPEEELMYKYSDVVLQWLKNKGLTQNRLITYGFSLGSAPATFSASGRSILFAQAPLIPGALILEAPFASASVLAQDATNLNVPAIYFTDLEINVAEYIKDVEAPFLWLHGIDDDFLNIETNGEVVFKNYRGSRSEAVRVAGANHGTLPQTLGYTVYLQNIRDFLNQ